MEKLRWEITVHYRTSSGIIDVDYAIDELSELEEIIERGPSWGALDHITIRYAFAKSATIEEEELL